ncbi:hypothetical protein KFU94_38915 [Chloroflexi bacterium TSY]|nr:hypothetical protein [Chloroflexi bacterium TSY]
MISYLVGLFGLVALVIGVVILVRPVFGEQFFGDWATLKLDVLRITVTSVVIASSWKTGPNLIFVVGCLLAVATVLFAIMARWQPGRHFVQSHLVDSKRGTRVYVLCAIIPMGALLVAGTILS